MPGRCKQPWLPTKLVTQQLTGLVTQPLTQLWTQDLPQQAPTQPVLGSPKRLR